MAITRLNVYAGMAGLYTIRDDDEDSLGLPAADYEVPLVLQDKSLNEDASLFYPTQGVSAAHPIWVPLFFGDIAFVNGKVWPYLDVEPRRYRFRLLNGSNSRVWNISFDAQGQRLGFHVIGSDGGLLPQAVPVDALPLAPGERYDVIVDFTDLVAGTVLTVKNDAAAPYPGGGNVGIEELMQVRVNKELSGTDESTPATALSLPEVPRFDTAGATTRQFILEEIMEDDANLIMLINNRRFNDPVEEMPAEGSTEIWEFANLSLNAHPLHIHLVQFQVLNHQLLDSTPLWTAWQDFNAGSGTRPDFADYLGGPERAPAPHENGWKDTVIVMPSEVTRVAVRFDLPPDTPKPARYVYHCHIIEHEDNEMMRPFDVV
jgi:spore coat protein A